MAAVPIYRSRYGPVDLAFQGSQNIMPIGLGPCSKAIEIYGRHQDKCWGSFPSQWHLQGDTSMSCTHEYNLDQFTGYYTGPQTNLVSTQSVPPTQESMMATQSTINASLRNPTIGSNGSSCSCNTSSVNTYQNTGYAAPYATAWY